VKGQGGEVEIDEIVKVLAALGIDETTARDELALAEDSTALAREVAALTVESEAGLLVPVDVELDTALFEVVDALRQAGVQASLGQVPGAPAVVLAGSPRRVHEVRWEDGATPQSLVAAIGGIVPSTHVLLHARDYDAGDALALVVLDRASHLWLRAAVGGDALDAALPTPSPGTGVVVGDGSSERLLSPDFAQRFQARVGDAGAGPTVEEVWSRICTLDARVPWPAGHPRPPGDDLYELTCALGREPLARALGSGDPAALANVLYRFALITSVGGHWDLLAARYNPGMSAQGLLGFGQLVWSWFILDALGAKEDAAAVARLLEHEWVRTQERGLVSARQRAWYDLGALMRGRARAPAVGRVRELLPLLQREGWQDPVLVAAALEVHTEPRGDQLTHQAMCYPWPAPLYALARRAGAIDLLAPSNPFLSRPLTMDVVDLQHEQVAWAKLQLSRFAMMEVSRLPALLDPLPVIVDAKITKVEGGEAHGHTMLCSHEDVEHHVVAPIGDKPVRVGETWLLEVTAARRSQVRRHYDDLGDVVSQVALPTGEWVRRVDDADA
jgi:hypothetical protein